MNRYLIPLLLTLAAQGCTTISDPAPTSSVIELAHSWVGPSSSGAMWRVVLNRDGETSTDGVAFVQGGASAPASLERCAVRSWRLDKYDVRIVMDAPDALRKRGASTIVWRGTVYAETNTLNLRSDDFWDQNLILQREDGFAARLERLKAEGD